MVHRENPAGCTKAIGRSVVLMARVVDCAGRTIRRSDIAAIKCSHRGHLEVGEVILPALVRDGLWTADHIGYNFRDELVLDRNVVNRKFGGCVELKYVFMSKDANRSIVRFRFRLV